MDKNHKIGGFSHFLIFLQTNQKLAGSALRPFGASGLLCSHVGAWAGRGRPHGLHLQPLRPSATRLLGARRWGLASRPGGRELDGGAGALAHGAVARTRPPRDRGTPMCERRADPVPRCLAPAAVTPPVRDPAAGGSTR